MGTSGGMHAMTALTPRKEPLVPKTGLDVSEKTHLLSLPRIDAGFLRLSTL
jgi:hypothetical protein